MKLLPLTPADYPALTPFFEHQQHRLCVYSLPSLLSWCNDEYQPFGAIDGDALIIAAEFNREKEKRHLILPISPQRQYSPEALHALARKLDFKSYWFVTEDYLQQYEIKRVEALFTIREQEEYNDYVYRTSDLTELKGNKYSKKRNLISQFSKEYLEKDRVRLAPITPEQAPECIRFLNEWCEERSCDANQMDDLACERLAALNTIEHLDIFSSQGLLLRIDGKVSAFGIGSYLTATMGVLHFEKAFSRIKGLYQYFDSQCARLLFNGYVFINKESDMNVPGLAKAKRSYYPAMRVKSYELVLKKTPG
ncbi:MAG: DUF2156 domain-containing protein [Deltaproteobacteria bacterium]|nr:DUF2156 domain-containing protein [Deltaproteobacteria bacterium]